MIDWSSGYSCKWRLYRVDLDTWADAEPIDGVRQMTITTDMSTTLQKGSMTIDAAVGDAVLDGYYRLVMEAEQAGVRQRVDVATLMLSASGGLISKRSDARTIECVSVLRPAANTRMPRGSFAPKGASGPEYVARMLRESIAAPVTYEGDFTIGEHHVFAPGALVLDSAWKILNSANYCIMLNGDGTVVVRPVPSEPSLELDDAHARMLLPEIRYTTPIGSVKNRYWAVLGEEVAVAVNDDPNSIVSHASRRTWNDAYDTSPVMTEGESLERYAHRRLLEQSTIGKAYTYKREWWPDVQPRCIVRGAISSVGFDSDMRVTAQKLTIGRGILVEESSTTEVRLWQG